jgi:hypothetical protein
MALGKHLLIHYRECFGMIIFRGLIGHHLLARQTVRINRFGKLSQLRNLIFGLWPKSYGAHTAPPIISGATARAGTTRTARSPLPWVVQNKPRRRRMDQRTRDALDKISVAKTGKTYANVGLIEISTDAISEQLFNLARSLPDDSKVDLDHAVFRSVQIVLTEWAVTGVIPDLIPDVSVMLRRALALVLSLSMYTEHEGQVTLMCVALPETMDQALALAVFEIHENPDFLELLFQSDPQASLKPLRRMN